MFIYLFPVIILGKDYRSEFDFYDTKCLGSILQSDFRHVMQERLKGAFSIAEVETIENLFRDVKDPRKLNHIKFLNYTHPRQIYNHSGHSSTGVNVNSVTNQPLASSTEGVWLLAEMLRLKIRRRCDYLTPGELKRPFRHFARSRPNKVVNFDDFCLAVKDLGFKLTGDQEIELFKYFNFSHSSSVLHNNSSSTANHPFKSGSNWSFTYTDFVLFTKDPFHQDIVWKFRRLMARARVSEQELEDAIRGYDSNSSGLITIKQFIKALDFCHIELSESDCLRLLLRFDSDESQRLDIEKFILFLHGYPTNTNTTLSATNNKIRTPGKENNNNILADENLGGTRNLGTTGGRGMDGKTLRSGSPFLNRTQDGKTELLVFNSIKERVEDKLDSGIYIYI